MIVNVTTPVRPACWNREPADPVQVRYGIDSDTGEVIRTEWRTEWKGASCASWYGRGIGSTEATTFYPVAHGWSDYCKTCKHLPPEGREAMGMTDTNEGDK